MALARSWRLDSPWIVAALLALHALLLFDGARRDGLTFDELAFLAGGASHLQTGDYRMAPDGAPLVQRLMGIPLVIAGMRSPGPDAPSWATSSPYAHGNDFLYLSGNDPARVLLLARLPSLLASVLTGLLAWAWSRRLFGPTGALVTLVLHATSPVFLSHGRLATADMLATLLFLAASWSCWNVSGRMSPLNLAASLLSVSLLFLAKMSAVLIIPVAFVLLAVRLASSEPLLIDLPGLRATSISRRSRAAALAAVFVIHGAFAVLVAWAVFDFRYAAARDVPAGVDVMRDGGWEAMQGAGIFDAPVRFARDHELLPEAWLFGFQLVVKHSRGRAAHALGRYSATGWWWYFPVAVFLKTPLAALALAALAAFVLAARLTGRAPPGSSTCLAFRTPSELWPLAALTLVYWATALTTPLNIGIRHVLPTLPAFMILCGAVACVATRSRTMSRAVTALVALAAIESLSGHPHHLAHMNALGGAPPARWRRLVDSSLDWGQGLPYLRERVPEWRREGHEDPVYLGYFGTADPAREGLDVRLLPGHSRQLIRETIERLEPGIYCISATVLAQVYPPRFPGRWSVPYEDRWRDIEHLSTSAGALEAMAPDPAERLRLVAWHDELRMARLCAWLRQREPDEAIAGGAILVYHLDAAELGEALHGAPAELVDVPDLPWFGSRQGLASAP